MLVDHTHALVDGVQGAGDLFFLSVDEDLAFVGDLHAKEHFHQGGFSGSVFTHKAVDLVSLNHQIHVPVGDKAVGIDLCNVLHSQHFIRHEVTSLYIGKGRQRRTLPAPLRLVQMPGYRWGFSYFAALT